jgi:hypothetical protein
MSAYVVDHKTINRVVTFLHFCEPHFKRPFEDLGYSPIAQPGELGNDLLAMNQEAVLQRYPDCDATDMPGPIDPPPYEFKIELLPSNVDVYSSVACLHYQCSEGDVIEQDLFKALTSLYHRLAHHIVQKSDAYERAEWG